MTTQRIPSRSTLVSGIAVLAGLHSAYLIVIANHFAQVDRNSTWVLISAAAAGLVGLAASWGLWRRQAWARLSLIGVQVYMIIATLTRPWLPSRQHLSGEVIIAMPASQLQDYLARVRLYNSI